MQINNFISHRSPSIENPKIPKAKSLIPLDPFQRSQSDPTNYPLKASHGIKFSGFNLEMGKQFLKAIQPIHFGPSKEPQTQTTIANNFRAACKNRNPALAIHWLEMGYQPTLSDHGAPELTAALRLKSPEVVQKLLEHGATFDGATPLHDFLILHQDCTDKNVLKIAKLLINHGAFLGTNARGETPLHLAAATGSLKLVKLIRKKVNADTNLDSQGASAVFYACRPSNPKVLKHLLKKNLPFKPLLNGGTLWTEACAFGSYKTLKLLKKRNLQDFIIDSVGQNPMVSLILNPKLSKPNTPFEHQLVKSLVLQDHGQTEELLERKLLAHRFGLDGISHIGKIAFSLEGLYPIIATSHLQGSMQSFYKLLQEDLLNPQPNSPWTRISKSLHLKRHADLSNIHTWLPGILEKAIEVVSNIHFTPPSKYHGDDLLLYSKIETHGIVTLLKKDLIYRCNKGFGHPDHKPGIIRSKITKPENIEEAFELLDKLQSSEDFYERLDKLLGLEEDLYIPQESQKIGNCTVANTNSAEVALLHSLIEPFTGSKIAAKLALAIKNERVVDARLGNLRTYLTRHLTPQSYPPDADLLYSILMKDNLSNVELRQMKAIFAPFIEKKANDPAFSKLRFMLED